MIKSIEINKCTFKHPLRIVMITLVMILVFFLSSCDYSYYLFYNDESNVNNIQLINYDCTGTTDDVIALDNISILETLMQDQHEEFISELSSIGGITGKYDNSIDYPCGTGILITYNDESFTIITVSENRDVIYLGEYDINSELDDYFGIGWEDMIDDFLLLLSEYFESYDN